MRGIREADSKERETSEILRKNDASTKRLRKVPRLERRAKHELDENEYVIISLVYMIEV